MKSRIFAKKQIKNRKITKLCKKVLVSSNATSYYINMLTIRKIAEEVSIFAEDFKYKKEVDKNILVVIDYDRTPEDKINDVPDSIGLDINQTDKTKYKNINNNFEIDISPAEVFLIFPEITFSFSVRDFTIGSWMSVQTKKFLSSDEWKIVRSEIEESDYLEKDISGITGTLISIDKMRNKMEDRTSTDKELIELRKNLYTLGYAIDEKIKEKYESK